MSGNHPSTTSTNAHTTSTWYLTVGAGAETDTDTDIVLMTLVNSLYQISLESSQQTLIEFLCCAAVVDLLVGQQRTTIPNLGSFIHAHLGFLDTDGEVVAHQRC